MWTILLVVWALYMLWSSLNGIKYLYFTSREEKESKLRISIDKIKNSGDEPLFTLSISLWAICITISIFWLIMALTFTNIFVVLYCCIVIASCIAAPIRSMQIIEKNEYKYVDRVAYVTTPINIVVIASFIIMLLL